MAKIVEQNPNIIEKPGEGFMLAAEMSRSEKEQHDLSEASHSLLVFSPDGRVLWKGPEAVAQQSRGPATRTRNPPACELRTNMVGGVKTPGWSLGFNKSDEEVARIQVEEPIYIRPAERVNWL